MASFTVTCEESREQLLQLVSTPRMRFGPKATWLATWNFPAPEAWSSALRLARERARAGCGHDDEAEEDGWLASAAQNLRLYASPCVTQCAVAGRAGSEQLRRCACRACNTSGTRETWAALLGACRPLHGELRRALAPLCAQLQPLARPGAACGALAAPSEFEGAPPGWEALAADPARCVTAFNESCCPRGEGGAVCGGPARGACEPIGAWTAASWAADARGAPRAGRCEWPVRFAAARCRCAEGYAGSACGGCARGRTGAGCAVARRREVRRSLGALKEAERHDFFAAVGRAAQTAEFRALEASHELGVSFFHETSHLLPSHHAYFEAIMELVRRTSGRPELPLPFWLPLAQPDLKLSHALHPRCLDCRAHPPANWSIEQVATQVEEAGLQGRQGGARVAALLGAARVDGGALMRLGARGLRALGLRDEEAAPLLPWLRRVQSPNPKVWGYGVHCCARWLTNMPGKAEWLAALRLPELGPLRGKMATVHRIGAGGRRWLEAFKALHQVHQWFHVVLGPCTALCHDLPRCDSNHCELLLPLHAAYDMLQRAWGAAHPAQPACVADGDLDFELDECLPFVTPLRSVRDECATPLNELPYEYEHLHEAWVLQINQSAR